MCRKKVACTTKSHPNADCSIGRTVPADCHGYSRTPSSKRERSQIWGDYFTKRVEAFPMPNMEASTVANLFVAHFVCRFGAPDALHTDQGRNFESVLLKEVCQLLGVCKTRTTPYHPQPDGFVERFNRTLLNLLSIALRSDERNWDYSHASLSHECAGVYRMYTALSSLWTGGPPSC